MRHFERVLERIAESPSSSARSRCWCCRRCCGGSPPARPHSPSRRVRPVAEAPPPAGPGTGAAPPARGALLRPPPADGAAPLEALRLPPRRSRGLYPERADPPHLPTGPVSPEVPLGPSPAVRAPCPRSPAGPVTCRPGPVSPEVPPGPSPAVRAVSPQPRKPRKPRRARRPPSGPCPRSPPAPAAQPVPPTPAAPAAPFASRARRPARTPSRSCVPARSVVPRPRREPRTVVRRRFAPRRAVAAASPEPFSAASRQPRAGSPSACRTLLPPPRPAAARRITGRVRIPATDRWSVRNGHALSGMNGEPYLLASPRPLPH